MSVLTSLPEWKELSKIAESVKSAHMRDWFASDGERAEKMSLSACGIYLDYSKNRVNEAALSSLFDLVGACNIEPIRTNMLGASKLTLPRVVPYCTPRCVISLTALLW